MSNNNLKPARNMRYTLYKSRCAQNDWGKKNSVHSIVAPSCWKYPTESSSSSNWHPTLHTPAWPKFSPFFGDRVISKGLWPPRSPDLTPSDYFLWGYLKGRVYQNRPRKRDALQANITEEIQAVTADVLARNFQNMARRVNSCLDENSGHFQHMLWCRHISYTMR